MEQKKQVVALSDIRSYLMKQEWITVIVILIVVLPIFYHAFFAADALWNKIAGSGCCLLGLYGLAVTFRNMQELRKNTFFTARTDTLEDKEQDVYSFHHRRSRNRLYFGKGHYDIYRYNGTHPLYDMQMQALYDTAFIDDSFTLICHRKHVLFAFNNKLYEIENDL